LKQERPLPALAAGTRPRASLASLCLPLKVLNLLLLDYENIAIP